jgi:pyruvate formate lyase activating enzyme
MKVPEKAFIPLISWDICSEKMSQKEDGVELPIRDFHKKSINDFPGYVSAVVFTQGCNFNCIYCYNQPLIPIHNKNVTLKKNKDVISWIERHRNLLDAVCITGGEPTIHQSLICFLRKIKQLGLMIKLDTNGSNPSMLRELISSKLVDYVALDIKTVLLPTRYSELIGIKSVKQKISYVKESIGILEASTNLKYDFRVTLLKKYHTVDDIKCIAKLVKGELVLQNFRNVEGLHPLKLEPFDELEKLKSYLRTLNINLR